MPAQPPEHISQHRTIWEWRRVLRHNFEVVQIRSILPVLGQRGILRLVNSHKLTVLCSALLGRHRVTALKERAGFGYTLIILAS